MPPATFSANSPRVRVPIEQACSTTSRPRKTSPSASGKVLPCSAVRQAANFFMSRRISSCSFSMIRARAPIGVFFQVLNACAAPSIAALISSWVANGTRARTSCVAGFTTSFQTWVFDSTNLPLINSFTLAWLAETADGFSRTAAMGNLLKRWGANCE